MTHFKTTIVTVNKDKASSYANCFQFNRTIPARLACSAFDKIKCKREIYNIVHKLIKSI